MGTHRYEKFLPELADQVNLQNLIEQLSDFLLQSGFTRDMYPLWPQDEYPGDNRSMDALRQAIMQALMESDQLTPEMLRYLRGESTGDSELDAAVEQQVTELIDKIIQRLMSEGYLKVDEKPQMPAGYQQVLGP